MITLNENINTTFITFSVSHYQNEIRFPLNSQWKWSQKSYGTTTETSHIAYYTIIADIDNGVIDPILIDEDLVVEETEKRPKIERTFYNERRGDLYIDGMEDYKQPQDRKRDSGMNDEHGYLKVNEGAPKQPKRGRGY